MDMLARCFVAGTVIVQLSVLIVCAETGVEEKPKAEKLTIAIDSVSPRLPPQIAYFITDSALNRTFGFNRNQPRSLPRPPPQPPIINLWPPNDPRNQTFNTFNITDLMMSQQRAYRYIAVPKAKIRGYVNDHDDDDDDDDDNDDADTADQNFNYQIDFAKIPDKEPDFKRFESIDRERDTVKRVKPKKYIKRPVSTNYANTSPNIRSKIKYIKIDHENKFDISKDKHRSSGSGSVGYSDELDNDTSDRLKVFSNKAKLKKSRRKKPHYSTVKLSHPTLSVENESSFFDNSNGEENANYHFGHHKNCDHQNFDLIQQQENDQSTDSGNGNDYDNTDITETNPGNKRGYAIYLTKVIKHPKPYRTLRMDKSKATHGFVPTRIMSSVRKLKKIIHKPRKMRKPTMRERIRESGGHVVYTEDGYEDKEYDHGLEDKSLEYRSRTRRSTSEEEEPTAEKLTNYKELKGQKLIDELDFLIKNVSEYLNSSEIIPDTDKKYPLYNVTEYDVEDSPIRYSEYAKPVVDNDFSTELYESKSDDCEDDDDDEEGEGEIDLSNAHNDTKGPKKRLGNLGNKLKCLKKKFFGKNPLDNPIFDEETVSQPSQNLFSPILQEADKIQAFSSVYDDVMDNIKYNSFNEHQRVFSDFGISNNFVPGSIKSKTTTSKPQDDLNTDETYSDEIKADDTEDLNRFTDDIKQIYSEDVKHKNNEKVTVTKSPLTAFNPFRDPAQLPILDISRYIPTAKYSATSSDSDIPLQTDFVPIVSPYSSSYSPNTQVTTTTTPKAPQPPQAPKTLPKYGPVRTLSPPLRKITPYPFVSQPNIRRSPPQSVVYLKNRRPVAVVRFLPKKPLGPRQAH